MAEWTKIGADALVGGGAGVADQLVQNWDEARALAERASGVLPANKKLPVMKQVGTYLNYGVPILALIGVATGVLKGDMVTRVVTAAGQLAARKGTHQLTTSSTSPTPSAAYTAWQRQAAAEASQRTATRTYQPEFSATGAQAW